LSNYSFLKKLAKKPNLYIFIIISAILGFLFYKNYNSKLIVKDISNFELKLRLKSKNLQSVNGGTLFQIKDKNDMLISYSGFNNVVNTRNAANKDLLSFYVEPIEENIEIIDIGNPFPNNNDWNRIYHVQNELWAVNSNNEIKIYDFKNNEWFHNERIKLNSTDFLIDIQRHDNQNLWIHHGVVYLNNRLIYKEKEECEIRGFEIVNDDVFIFRNAAKSSIHEYNQLSIGKLKYLNDVPYIEILNSFDGKCPNARVGDIYCWTHNNGYFYASTNSGHTYRLNKDEIFTITERDIYDPNLESWQAYTFINYYDKIILGHYPTGNLFELTESKVESSKYLSELPVIDNIMPNEREAQTLAIYSGYLMCGVWPWGELFGYKNKDWKWRNRFFEYPKERKELAPFVDRLTFNLDYLNNQWGQRIIDLTPIDKYLAVNTAFKYKITDDDKKYLYPKEIEQYGKVYLLEIPTNISSTISVSDEIELIFKSINNTIAIYQDGILLTETIISDHNNKKGYLEILPEKGIFGSSNYELIDYKLSN
jgi:hypothetical protein